MEKNDLYENYVSVFTVLPAGNHFISREAMGSGLPTKLSQSDVTDSDVNFFRNLNHFTFIFVSDKKFRAAAPTAESARASMDVTIQRMENWKNANDCKEIISKFRRLRSGANASNFNLTLFNHTTLSAGCVAAIALVMLKTIPIDTISWLSDRDKIIDDSNGITFTMFHLNMVAFAQKEHLRPFNLVWFGEKSNEQTSSKKKPLPLAPYIRIPDYFAAPIASLQAKGDGVRQLDKNKYQRVLAFVIADNPQIAVLRLVNDPGWGLQALKLYAQ